MRRSSKVLRRAFVLVVVLTVAAAALAAVAASPAHATPSRNTACTSCHTGAASGTVTATPSTSTPAPGASYTVAISIGLTASGTTGYHIAQTDAAGSATTWVAVYGGPASQTAWTATMTAPATAGTYYYKVWTAKGPDNSSGQAKSALYSITVPGPAVTAAITSLTPNHAQTGASVVIAGTNLGTSGTVRFGSATASTTAWSATSITAAVPAGLATGATTVTVTPTGGSASNAAAFTVDAPPAPTAAITSLSPASGPVGTSFTITGSNLGASGAVTVGGVTAATSAWSATSVTCTVPAGLTVGSKNVVVTPAGAAASNALAFTVTVVPAPTAAITSLTPNHAQTGASVVIAGTNLGTSGTVRFGSATASTTAWSATSITAAVPAGLGAGATTVTVTPTGGSASNAAAFTVDAPPAPTAAITSLSPASGPVGTSFTITGSNLGASGAVTVGGVTAATSAWSATTVTGTVPAGLTVGSKNVVVTPAGGAASNALSFTVTAPPAPTDSTAPATVATGAQAGAWASDVVTVALDSSDEAGGSGVAKIVYRVDGGALVTVNAASVDVHLGLPSAPEAAAGARIVDGPHSLEYYAVDVAGNAEPIKTLTINIDSTKPLTRAASPARVRKGRTATLKYEVRDAEPNAGTATVDITIKNKRGKVVKRLHLGARPVNTVLKATFRCTLRPGIYRFSVRATDAAGNAQAKAAVQTLTVR